MDEIFNPFRCQSNSIQKTNIFRGVLPKKSHKRAKKTRKWVNFMEIFSLSTILIRNLCIQKHTSTREVAAHTHTIFVSLIKSHRSSVKYIEGA